MLSRADTLRDERGAEGDQKLERWLRDAAGWLPVRSESARSIASLNAAITALPLRDTSDADLAQQLHTAMAALRTDANDAAALALVAH